MSRQDSASQRRTSCRSGTCRYNKLFASQRNGPSEGAGEDLHLARLGTNVGKCIEYMRQFVSWQVLGVIVSAVDGLRGGVEISFRFDRQIYIHISCIDDDPVSPWKWNTERSTVNKDLPS